MGFNANEPDKPEVPYERAEVRQWEALDIDDKVELLAEMFDNLSTVSEEETDIYSTCSSFDSNRLSRDSVSSSRDSSYLSRDLVCLSRVSSCLSRESFCSSRDSSCLSRDSVCSSRESICLSRESVCSSCDSSCVSRDTFSSRNYELCKLPVSSVDDEPDVVQMSINRPERDNTDLAPDVTAMSESLTCDIPRPYVETELDVFREDRAQDIQPEVVGYSEFCDTSNQTVISRRPEVIIPSDDLDCMCIQSISKTEVFPRFEDCDGIDRMNKSEEIIISLVGNAGRYDHNGAYSSCSEPEVARQSNSLDRMISDNSDKAETATPSGVHDHDNVEELFRTSGSDVDQRKTSSTSSSATFSSSENVYEPCVSSNSTNEFSDESWHDIATQTNGPHLDISVPNGQPEVAAQLEDPEIGTSSFDRETGIAVDCHRYRDCHLSGLGYEPDVMFQSVIEAYEATCIIRETELSDTSGIVDELESRETPSGLIRELESSRHLVDQSDIKCNFRFRICDASNRSDDSGAVEQRVCPDCDTFANESNLTSTRSADCQAGDTDTNEPKVTAQLNDPCSDVTDVVPFIFVSEDAWKSELTSSDSATSSSASSSSASSSIASSSIASSSSSTSSSDNYKLCESSNSRDDLEVKVNKIDQLSSQEVELPVPNNKPDVLIPLYESLNCENYNFDTKALIQTQDCGGYELIDRPEMTAQSEKESSELSDGNIDVLDSTENGFSDIYVSNNESKFDTCHDICDMNVEPEVKIRIDDQNHNTCLEIVSEVVKQFENLGFFASDPNTERVVTTDFKLRPDNIRISGSELELLIQTGSSTRITSDTNFKNENISNLEDQRWDGSVVDSNIAGVIESPENLEL